MSTYFLKLIEELAKDGLEEFKSGKLNKEAKKYLEKSEQK